MKTQSFSSTLIGLLVAGCAASCLYGTVQPIGWQGAGRMQSLPEIMPDGGGAMVDSGIDADTGVDAGDSGEGTGFLPDGALSG